MTDGTLISRFEGNRDAMVAGRSDESEHKTVLTDGLNWVWNTVSSPFQPETAKQISMEDRLKPVIAETLRNGAQIKTLIVTGRAQPYSLFRPRLSKVALLSALWRSPAQVARLIGWCAASVSACCKCS